MKRYIVIFLILLVIPVFSVQASGSGIYDTNQLQLYEGWNFISVPGPLATDSNTFSIFDNVDMSGHSGWYYNGSGGRWEKLYPDSPIQPLSGYWIYSASPITENLQISSDSLQVIPTKELKPGWNSMGFTGDHPATAKDTLTSVKNNWTQVEGFDAMNQSFEPQIINGGSGVFDDSRLMEPGMGYWIYLIVPGNLTSIEPIPVTTTVPTTTIVPSTTTVPVTTIVPSTTTVPTTTIVPSTTYFQCPGYQ